MGTIEREWDRWKAAKILTNCINYQPCAAQLGDEYERLECTLIGALCNWEMGQEVGCANCKIKRLSGVVLGDIAERR